MTQDLSPGALWLDLRLALALFTRLPAAPRSAVPEVAPEIAPGGTTARALRLAPLAGAAVGIWAGAVFWAASGLGLGALLAAAVALAATLVLTGALHEDGLADLADGLGGGRDPAERLRIMRDSRIGSFGALALVGSVTLRALALAALAPGGEALAALVAAHSLARAPFAAVMACLPAARSDGLAFGVGQPPPGAAGLALAIAALVAVAFLGAGQGLVAVAVAALAAGAVAMLASRRLGGYTGDVLGSVEQAVEVAVLVALVALR